MQVGDETAAGGAAKELRFMMDSRDTIVRGIVATPPGP